MRKVFVDLGANVGDVSATFAAENPEHEIFCVEPNINLIPQIHRRGLEVGRVFSVICGAAWVFDGTIDLFLSGAPAASTIVPGKIEINGWPQIDYSAGQVTPCFDFSRWLMENFDLRDQIIVKMDIEGAEYDLLSKMIGDKSIFLVDRLLCEWHLDRFPALDVPKNREIQTKISNFCNVEHWS